MYIADVRCRSTNCRYLESPQNRFHVKCDLGNFIRHIEMRCTVKIDIKRVGIDIITAMDNISPSHRSLTCNLTNRAYNFNINFK